MALFFFFFFFLLPLFSLFLHPSHASAVLVDGVSEWKNPVVHVGDSIIFNHKLHYKLYIFRSKNAFDVCNFSQATLLTKPNSASYMWHPSRTGFFYFTFNNGSLNSCQSSQKLSIEVSAATPSPESSPIPTPGSVITSPAPVSGGGVSSAPVYPWPFQPREEISPGPAPSSGMMPIIPDKNGGIPFINSNPAVPLPTGEVDSATIRPLPTSAQGEKVVVGLFAVPLALFSVALLTL